MDRHTRLVARRSLACRRDIIIRQASVRQAKLVSSALARPRHSQPASRIRSFLCSSFFATTCPRRYSGRIHASPRKESLGFHPRIICEPGISEYFVAWKCGVCERIGGVSGRVAAARCEDIGSGRGSEPGGECHANSHGIYRRCPNSTQRNYGDSDRDNRARKRPRGARAVIQPHATQRTSFFPGQPDSGRSLRRRYQTRICTWGSRNYFLRMAGRSMGVGGGSSICLFIGHPSATSRVCISGWLLTPRQSTFREKFAGFPTLDGKRWNCDRTTEHIPVRTVSPAVLAGKKLGAWISAAQFEIEGKTKIVVTGRDGTGAFVRGRCRPRRRFLELGQRNCKRV